jgi:hypothetical protein
MVLSHLCTLHACADHHHHLHIDLDYLLYLLYKI